MKKLFLIIIVFIFLVQIASGQSKVAVLDASLGEGVHSNASAIVADTLNEQFVKSGDFIAIDRAYISSIQEEKQFQISGEVSSDDIKELGITFGAKYLCIANVSLLGNTYSVSARLIEVETAQVVSQESARMQGQIDVLFEIAEEVGTKLLGKDFTRGPTPQPAAEGTPSTEKPTPVKRTVAKPGEKRPHFTFGYMFAGFMGAEDSMNTDYTIYELDDYAVDFWGAPDSDLTTWGIDLHLLVPLRYIYWSLGVSYTNQSIWAGNDSYAESYEVFSTVSPAIGIGGIYPVGANFQLYGGLNLGYLVFIAGSDYGDDAIDSLWVNAGESAGGVSFGLELGADYFFKSFSISARYKLSRTGDLTGDEWFSDDYEDAGGDTSFGVQGLVLGVGFTW